jgi:hypothetical protein
VLAGWARLPLEAEKVALDSKNHHKNVQILAFSDAFAGLKKKCWKRQKSAKIVASRRPIS